MIKIQHWKPQSKLLRYYIESYFLLCSEGQESISSFELDKKKGVFVCLKKNAFINKENTSISICSTYSGNKISLEIFEYLDEGIIQQRVYSGAITEVIIKLNENYKHFLFSKIAIDLPSFYTENFQFLYPNMESNINSLFCNKTPKKDKIKYLDQILMEYHSFYQVNGIEIILQKNKIKL